MPLSDTVRHQADTMLNDFCERRVPLDVRDRVRMHHEFYGDYAILFEDRPRWDNPEEWIHSPIAKFRFNMKEGKWTLYWPDGNLKWHKYNTVQPSANLGKLLQEVDNDPTRIFFG